MLCGSLRNRIHTWLSDYVLLQSSIVVLIYAQVWSALIGSLGAQYNGVLLMNLGIALFALVAIESNSRTLFRDYMFLLFSAILLDISWFIFFFKEIWNISSEKYQALYIYSVKLTMAMEAAGFIFRLSSSLLLFQIYRLGASTVDNTSLPPQSLSDSDLRNSFLEPPVIANQRSRSDDILRESFHEPANNPPLIVDGERSITSPRTTQIYRLGASTVDNTSLPRQSLSDSDLRNSFLDPPPVTGNQRSEEVHEPAYSSPLIVDGESNITPPKTTQIHALYREKYQIQTGKSSRIEELSCFMEIDVSKPWCSLQKAIQELWWDYLSPPQQDIKSVCLAYRDDKRFPKMFLHNLLTEISTKKDDEENVINLLFKKVKDKIRRKERENEKKSSEVTTSEVMTQVITHEDIEHNKEEFGKHNEKNRLVQAENRRVKNEETKRLLREIKKANSKKSLVISDPNI